MKRIVVLIGVALLVMMVGMAQADYLDPSDIHVNGGTTYLFQSGTEVHALTNPSTISLAGDHNGVTISDVILVFAVPGESETLATTANGVSGVNAGDLTGAKGSKFVYPDILGLSGADNSQSFANYTTLGGLPAVDTTATNFDIWTFDQINSSALSNDSSVLVNFLNGVPDGTFVFAYGFGSDDKLYVTPITETGFQGPPQVPEPGMLMLFGSGLLGLGLLARKGFRK